MCFAIDSFVKSQLIGNLFLTKLLRFFIVTSDLTYNQINTLCNLQFWNAITRPLSQTFLIDNIDIDLSLGSQLSLGVLLPDGHGCISRVLE